MNDKVFNNISSLPWPCNSKFYFIPVFFVNYVHGDCPEDCTSKFTQDMATLTTPAQACV